MRIARFGIRAAALVIAMMTSVAASTPGGTSISNAVTITYNDGAKSYNSQSNTVATTVAQVSALVVAPKNSAANASTDGFQLNQPVTRTFTITNTSNIPDAYTITSLSASAGSIASIAFAGANGALVPATVNGTASQTIAPGTSVTVIVVITTTGVAAGTAIAVSLGARTTVSGTQTGLVSDTGRQFALATGMPQIGGNGAGTLIGKTVDGVASESSAPGSLVTYKISFQNYGQVPATNAIITDNVPAGIHADASSVKVNGTATPATLTGQVLTVALGTVAANVPTAITFSATVDGAQTLGSSFVNTASFAADGVPAIGTTPASVLVGTSDIVYDGAKGAKSPIGGAVVTLVDPKTHLPLALSTIAASSSRANAQANLTGINPQNVNPFRTGGDGAYAFMIPVPSPGTTLALDIMIAAPGYLKRDIGAVLTPDASGVLYSVGLTSKDGQPLASAGGYTLTTASVALNNVFSLLGNLPLFTAESITVSKTADKAQAAPGDRVAYTIAFSSSGQVALTTTTITDSLPAGMAYAPGTARLDNAAVEPQTSGRQLAWTLPGMQPGVTHTITYDCVLLPSVNAGSQLTNTVAIAGTITGTMLSATGNGSVSVIATDGVFTQRSVITGRVFADLANTGHFRAGDKPLGGVRLFLESGESVTTDATGRFSFPGVRGGMHVLRLDETTLPAGTHAFDDRGYDSPRSPIRLIHNTLDMGLMSDVSFAVEAAR